MNVMDSFGPLFVCVNAEMRDVYTRGVSECDAFPRRSRARSGSKPSHIACAEAPAWNSRSRRGAEGTTTPVEADYADTSPSLVQSSKNVPQQDTAESGHDRE